MRRSRLATLLGTVLLATFLVVTPTVAATEPVAGPTAATPVAEPLPAIRLGCALVIPVPRDVRPAIVCRWAAPVGVDVRAYRLWRSVDGGARELIARVPAGDPLRHADRAIARGHAYTYRVVGIGADGSRVALSNLETIRIGRPAEALRFRCAFVIADEARGVGCRWSEATRPAAERYVLLRSVDGGPREKIYRTGLDGRRAFLDTDIKAGQHIRYAVVALAADGRVVGLGGPVRVRIPDGTRTATTAVAATAR